MEKKSRFIGYITPLAGEQDALDFIKALKKKHYDASHNVYAYILRENNIKRFSDDGEPQGTAGMPVLDVLEREGLVDVAVVVTRYFGGTLLGASGLIRAYARGAKLAVDSGETVWMTECQVLRLEMDYAYYGGVTKLLEEYEAVIVSSDFADIVRLDFRLPMTKVPEFCGELTERMAARLAPQILREEFAAISG